MNGHGVRVGVAVGEGVTTVVGGFVTTGVGESVIRGAGVPVTTGTLALRIEKVQVALQFVS
jgi:hypothetical protein